MDGKSEVLLTLCLECHNELNECYTKDVSFKKVRFKSKNFEEFYKTYKDLRSKFYDKKINRSVFGEGLWSNLVSYLEVESEKK